MEVTAFRHTRTTAGAYPELQQPVPPAAAQAAAVPNGESPLPAACAQAATARAALLRTAAGLVACGGWLSIAAFGIEGFAAWQSLIRTAALLLLGGAIALWRALERAQRRHIFLLEQDAAAGERRRISLDLHDSAIQPYLGLRLGLEALRRKTAADNALARDIDELCLMTQESIAELRGYVGVLRGRPGQGALTDGLRRQVERFSGFYGLEVELDLAADIEIDDRLAGEVVRMVGEGLSNIGRHSESRQVKVALDRQEDQLVLRIIERGVGNMNAWRQFTPASLTLRTEHLGGTLAVLPQGHGGTMIRIVIPLGR